MVATVTPVIVDGQTWAVCTTEANAAQLKAKLVKKAPEADVTTGTPEGVLFNPKHADALAALRAAGYEVTD